MSILDSRDRWIGVRRDIIINVGDVTLAESSTSDSYTGGSLRGCIGLYPVVHEPVEPMHHICPRFPAEPQAVKHKKGTPLLGVLYVVMRSL